jgi:hypothetical protein
MANFLPSCSNFTCPNHGKSGIKLRCCARCRGTRYCSIECQTQDWPLHQSFCGDPSYKKEYRYLKRPTRSGLDRRSVILHAACDLYWKEGSYIGKQLVICNMLPNNMLGLRVASPKEIVSLIDDFKESPLVANITADTAKFSCIIVNDVGFTFSITRNRLEEKITLTDSIHLIDLN